MESLFGIPINSIMLVLVALLGVSLASVGYVVLRSRIMFLIGLRNIPRRVAQTVLIIIGLMLSTLIISAAFTTGDTVDRSITNQTLTNLGHIDEVLQFESQEEEGDVFGAEETIPQSVVDTVEDGLVHPGSDVDGVLPLILEGVPVINPSTGLSEPLVNLVGVDGSRMGSFPDILSVDSGEQLSVSVLAADEAYVNESAAEELDAEIGDTVQTFVQNQPFSFRIVDIVKDRLLTGSLGGFVGNEGLVTRLDTVQAIFGQEGEVDAIAISNSGGVRDGIELTDAVVASAERVIAEEGLDLDVEPFKQDAVDEAELVGNLMATLFLVFGLFAIAPGILLIVMIFVMLAAERKSEMGMARAVGTKRGQLVQTFMSEGMAYNLGAAAVGAALGILVSLGITQLMARIFSEFGLSIQPHVTLRGLVISYSLGVVLTFATVTFASWRISKLNIVRAIRDIPEPTGGRMGWRSVAVALAAIALGALLFVTGMANDSQFPFALGFSLIVFGAAIVLRFFRLPDRPVFTAMGLLLLLLWGLVAGHRQEFLFGELEGDIEMFFLSGIVVVAASTFVLIYNADLMLAVVSRLGGRFGRILPAMKTAVAYPLASKFRTGMTLAMISLVIFALTIMFGLSAYFDRIALSDEARGGWDVLVQENANNPIEPDLTQALAGSIDVSQFRAVGRVDIPHRFTVPEVRNVGDGEFDTYPVRGVDRAFLEGGDIQLEARAVGFESDRQVWVALRDNPKFAVVDFLAVQHDPFDESKFRIEGIDEGDDTFERVTIEVRDPVSSQTAEVEVIGVISLGSSSPAAFLGIYVPEETFNQLFGEAEFSHYYVGLNDPGRAGELAKSIEAALLTSGAQASSIKEDIEDEQALQRNFFRLIQGFMGLGLFVGIAAVGVISFRTVVERRQQIGVLRAIGYSRGMVSLSFLLESTFVTALGILSGIGLAIWLSYFLISGNEFSTSDVGYVIPWVEILFISAFAFFASLVMTIVPSRRAASIPPAEALRYE